MLCLRKTFVFASICIEIGFFRFIKLKTQNCRQKREKQKKKNKRIQTESQTIISFQWFLF